MAKMFYTLEEACEKLHMSEDQIKALVRDAKLREFRDAGKINFKVEEVDALVAEAPTPEEAAESGSGELVLEPADESTIDLAMGSTGDMLSLEEAELDDTSTGEKPEKDKKDDTVVTSVGVSVFDEEELEGVADPLAQTVVSESGAGGLGIEGVGSGSGLLDLTRESDDTSLGAELLDEIHLEEEGGGVEMGDATRAGLEEAIEEVPTGDDIFEASGVPTPKAVSVGAPAAAVVVSRMEFAPDAWSTGLTGVLAVVTAVMLFAGLAIAASVRGVKLPVMDWLYPQLWMFGAGAAVLALAALGIGFLIGRRGPG